LLAAAAVGWLLLLGTGHRLWPLYRPPLKEQPTSGEEEIVWGPDEPWSPDYGEWKKSQPASYWTRKLRACCGAGPVINLNDESRDELYDCKKAAKELGKMGPRAPPRSRC